VRRSMPKGFAVLLVLAAVLVPAAMAASQHRQHPSLNLALVPLPKARLGPAAAGLDLAPGSGKETDGSGREIGYELLYGSPFLSNPGLDEVVTRVERFKTRRDANQSLALSKKQLLGELANFTQLNLTSTTSPLSISGIGDRRWGVLATFSVANYGSLYDAFESFSDGKYVLELVVVAGSQDLATTFVAAKAHMFDRRLDLGFDGRLHGHPVALPKFPPKLGPPASGPDPATAVLQTSDLPGSQVDYEDYSWLSGALSAYAVNFQPAGGAYDSVNQIVSVMPTTNGAAFVDAFIGAEELAFLVAFHPGSTVASTPVDVSAAGDEAQAAIASVTGPSLTANVAVVTLHSGPLADIVLAESKTTIDPATVQTLAQSAATRLDAAH